MKGIDPTLLTVRLATMDDVAAIRQLVNEAYQELGAMGLNYTGVDQDDDVTRRRMEKADTYLLYGQQELLGTVSIKTEPNSSGEPCIYVNQLAIRPAWKRRGLGSFLMDLVEREAAARGLSRVRLDTAIPATHLLAFYARRGYQTIGEVQWEGKMYRSVIMERIMPEL